jgi:hypothetical protein
MGAIGLAQIIAASDRYCLPYYAFSGLGQGWRTGAKEIGGMP